MKNCSFIFTISHLLRGIAAILGKGLLIFRRLTSLLIILIFLCGGIFALQISRYFGSIEIKYYLNSQEQKIINSINHQLKKKNLPAVMVSAQLCNTASDYTDMLLKQNNITIDHDKLENSLYKYGCIITNHRPFSAEYSSIDSFLNKNISSMIKEVTSLTNYQMGISVKKHFNNNSFYIFIIFADNLVNIEPFPSQVEADQTYPLKGKLLSKLSNAQVVVTDPGGKVEKTEVTSRYNYFQTDLRFEQGEGRYQIEILGEDQSGPRVAAIFPVYVGAYTGQSKTAYPINDKKYQDAQEAESDMIKLINYDRSIAGLPPLK